MAVFNFTMQRASASSTLDVGSVLTAAATPRRFKIMQWSFGSEAVPAENQFLWQINKRTGAATGGTAVTGQPLDDSDTIASTLVGNQAPTANGAGSGLKFALPLNQRASVIWQPKDGKEIIAAAVASSGFAVSTPTAAAVAVTSGFHCDEL